jgi:hypothetical protein
MVCHCVSIGNSFSENLVLDSVLHVRTDTSLCAYIDRTALQLVAAKSVRANVLEKNRTFYAVYIFSVNTAICEVIEERITHR